MEKEIDNSLGLARNFLVNSQTPEGNWNMEALELKGPEHLRKPLVLTSQAIEALVYLGLDNTNTVSKGMFYCFKEKLEDTDAVELLAYQLKTLSYSNAPYIQKKAKHLLKIILNRQSKEGYWPSFPKSSNLTNFIVVDGLMGHDCKENLEKIKTWLLKHKAKDGIAWGINESSDKSEVSFTANVVLSLLYSGEDVMSKDVQSAVKFFESKQSKDGGWPSSELTYPVDSTTYSTSLVVLVLLMTMENINDKTIEKGIKFLLDSQLPDGSWPLKKGDPKGEYFTTGYAVKTLRYYKYLKEKLNDENTLYLLKKVEKKQYLANFLLKEFENEIRRSFIDSSYNNLLDKILATTSSAVKRRKTILNILENEGEKDTANIIDALKRLDGYKVLHKRSHLAQIKNDMDALVNLGFVEEKNRKYFLVKKIGNY